MRDRNPYLSAFVLILVLYAFLVSIQLMGSSLKLFGKDFAESLIGSTANPVVGLLIGILVTSLIQSSSTTTCIVVGMVAGGVVSLRNAIPIVMGANIGTTVTNTIISMGHITRRHEFERAFSGATVHDFFNILSVIVLLPIELATHILEKSASAMSRVFIGVGGVRFVSPLKVVVQPTVNAIEQLIGSPVVMLVLALLLLFFSLTIIVRTARSLVVTKMEVLLDRYLFKNDGTGFLLGMIFTATVQSSSVTTSVMIPLVGAGLLTVRRMYPYTLGANVGTTVTAFLASLVTLNPAAITVSFTHFLFNVFGIAIFYPLKSIPIWLSTALARVTTRSRKNVWLFLTLYYLLHILPLLFILLFREQT